jgi:hypothetical protein
LEWGTFLYFLSQQQNMAWKGDSRAIPLEPDIPSEEYLPRNIPGRFSIVEGAGTKA